MDNNTKHPCESSTLKTIKIPSNLSNILVEESDKFLKQLKIKNPLGLTSDKNSKQEYTVHGEFMVADGKILIWVKSGKMETIYSKEVKVPSGSLADTVSNTS